MRSLFATSSMMIGSRSRLERQRREPFCHILYVNESAIIGRRRERIAAQQKQRATKRRL